MKVTKKLTVMQEIEVKNTRKIKEWEETRKMTQPETKIYGVLLDVRSGVAAAAVIEKKLDGYYKALRCDCIDIVRRRIGGRAFYIICDDAGLLKSNYRLSAVDSDGNPQLVGNLFVVQDDVQSLTPEEAIHVLKHTRKIVDVQNREIRSVLVCDY